MTKKTKEAKKALKVWKVMMLDRLQSKSIKKEINLVRRVKNIKLRFKASLRMTLVHQNLKVGGETESSGDVGEALCAPEAEAGLHGACFWGRERLGSSWANLKF